MKIYELFEKRETYKLGSIPVVKLPRDHKVREPNSEPVGDPGAQGNAVEHPKDGNTVIKYAEIKMPFEDDPYVQFINMCLYHQDNPFLPKVKSVKIIDQEAADDWKRVTARVGTVIAVMERLEHIDPDIDDEYGKFIACAKPNIKYFEKTFYAIKRSDWEYELIRKNSYREVDENLKIPVSLDAIGSWFFGGGGFDDMIRTNEILHAFDNKLFHEAVKLLKPLVRIFGSDLHENNVMLRGNQLVIIDPVFVGHIHDKFIGQKAGHR